LLNRRAWEKSLAAEEARARRYGSPTCVLVIDIDELKQINDSLDHAQGDVLLRDAAKSLKTAVRQNDVVARIGGDEFANWLSNVIGKDRKPCLKR